MQYVLVSVDWKWHREITSRCLFEPLVSLLCFSVNNLTRTFDLNVILTLLLSNKYQYGVVSQLANVILYRAKLWDAFLPYGLAVPVTSSGRLVLLCDPASLRLATESLRKFVGKAEVYVNCHEIRRWKNKTSFVSDGSERRENTASPIQGQFSRTRQVQKTLKIPLATLVSMPVSIAGCLQVLANWLNQLRDFSEAAILVILITTTTNITGWYLLQTSVKVRIMTSSRSRISVELD